MQPGLRKKLDDLLARDDAIQHALITPEVIDDPTKATELYKEAAKLATLSEAWRAYAQYERELAESAQLMNDEPDDDLRAMAADEHALITEKMAVLEADIAAELIPEDPLDGLNVYLEIRAGTGGDEAAIFAGDLFRMYSRYAEAQRWQVETLSIHEGEMGGYKEIISRLTGKGVYSRLKFESGAHRVQRVPATESQGRVHTSACTVAILPEVTNDESIEVRPQDLRVDTFRASGAGGQHVNKTDSAVRLTHLPTGTVVECQEGRSQHQNKAKAMDMLHAKLASEARRKRDAEQSATRKSLVGSGDRSERIRTYNFPQGRITDHRIQLTEYKLSAFMEGALDLIIDPLIREHQAAEMLAMENTS